MRGNQFGLPRIEEMAAVSGGEFAEGAKAGRVLRELCHDLIVPAATIRMLADAAHQHDLPRRDVGRHLTLISAEAARISALCSHVLGRARPRGPVRLDELVVEQIRSLRTMYRTKLEYDADHVLAHLHPAIFVRVIGNLLANACQAAGPDGLVRLTLTGSGDMARVAVDDSGPGLTAPKYGQASYGLQIVCSLVLECQGSVRMDVSDLGGMRFTVEFPTLPERSSAATGGGGAKTAPVASRNRPGLAS